MGRAQIKGAFSTSKKTQKIAEFSNSIYINEFFYSFKINDL